MIGRLGALLLAAALLAGGAARAANPPMSVVALPGGRTLGYFVSAPPGHPGLTRVLIAVQGYVRDANRTFAAAAAAARAAGRLPTTLIVAPIFQVPDAEAARSCHFRGMPGAVAGNALWRCEAWLEGAPAINTPETSFQATDRLIDHLLRAYPAVREVTIVGFSAGGQFVQRYAAFAGRPGRAVRLRYVVADPSGFLYFDAFRPQSGRAACPGFDDWKFGTAALPAYLVRSAAAARAAYVAADVRYLEGALDHGRRRGTAYRLLEKGCAAELQGSYRLDRGEAYAAYDRAMLAHGRHTLTVVPGCAHSVTCVLTAPAAGDALFGW